MGWNDYLEFIPAYRAGEEAVKGYKDISKGDYKDAAFHLAYGAANILPVTSAPMEGIALANAISGGKVSDWVDDNVASKVGIPNPLAADPDTTPVGDIKKGWTNPFDLGWLWKYLGYILLIGGGAIVLIILLFAMLK